MQTGTKISGMAHLVLVGGALFGGTFSSDPDKVEVHEVSVISSVEFAAMTTSPATPNVAAEPVALTRPDPDTGTPEVTTSPDATPEKSPPDQAAQPAPDSNPQAVPATPAPQAEVSETAPALEPPQTDVPTDVPQSPVPPQRPVDRVAPVPVAPPPPDVAPAEVETPQVTPDDSASETPQEPQDAAAPEEAADRIITEADAPKNLAPTRSPRPAARPNRRPTQPAPQTTQPSETAAAVNDAVNDAVAEAMGAAAPVPVPTGPPLTGGEKDALRVAVSSCWNVGSLSSAALQTTVVVGVSLSQNGKPDAGSIRLLSSSGGPDAAARQAFETARRAIIRCGAKGFDLPVEKYGQWRSIEMTFNPERMQIK